MKRSSLIGLILLLCIVIVAVFFRFSTFTLPHDNGDQIFYLGLAMKLDESGFSGYTLRNIDVKSNDFIIGLFSSDEEKGILLKSLAVNGITYYDEPLFHRSYGFPYMLMYSHRIFMGGEPYLTLKTTGRDKMGAVYSEGSENTWPVQFYAVVVPFFFSILLILATYFLGRKLFSARIGLISAFLISISPIEILSSQKIWSDTALAFFVILTVILFFQARERDNLMIFFLTGVTCGVATLIKQSGGFILVSILIFCFWQRRSDFLRLKNIPQIIFDKRLTIIVLGVALTTFHWFYEISRVYGNPLYFPTYTGLKDQVKWFIILDKRPVFLFLVSIPYLVPVFALSYLSICTAPFMKNYNNEKKTFLIIWVLTFLAMLMYIGATKENRYMLPAYPAIAMLSAGALERIRLFIDGKLKKNYGDIFVIVVLIACAFWSAPIGIRNALMNSPLILKPF